MDASSNIKRLLKNMDDSSDKTVNNRAILQNVADLSKEYMLEMSEHNKCIKKLLGDIDVLAEKLRAERAKCALLEKQLLETIGMRTFNTFVKVCKNRDCTQDEWSKFYADILTGKMFNDMVYKWVENNIK
jgi:hypothetical protein